MGHGRGLICVRAAVFFLLRLLCQIFLLRLGWLTRLLFLLFLLFLLVLVAGVRLWVG